MLDVRVVLRMICNDCGQRVLVSSRLTMMDIVVLHR